MHGLPSVTIIIPTLNQVEFIERTICSVLDQDYDNLEFIIVDGGSTDGTIDLIRMYEDYLSWWISAPGLSQARAVNKALAQAEGRIIGVLDGDDLYLPFVLDHVAERFTDSDRPQWLVGGCTQIDADDQMINTTAHRAPRDLAHYLTEPADALPSASTFWSARLFEQFGHFDAMHDYQFRFEFNCRLMAAGLRPTIIDLPLAHRRLHAGSKSATHHLMTIRQRTQIKRIYTRQLARGMAPTAADAASRRAA